MLESKIMRNKANVGDVAQCYPGAVENKKNIKMQRKTTSSNLAKPKYLNM